MSHQPPPSGFTIGRIREELSGSLTERHRSNQFHFFVVQLMVEGSGLRPRCYGSSDCQPSGLVTRDLLFTLLQQIDDLNFFFVRKIICASTDTTGTPFLREMPNQSCGVMSRKLLTAGEAVHDGLLRDGMITLSGVLAIPHTGEARDAGGRDRWQSQFRDS